LIKIPDSISSCCYETVVKILQTSNGATKAIYGGTRKVNSLKNFETVVNISELQTGSEVNLISLVKCLL